MKKTEMSLGELLKMTAYQPSDMLNELVITGINSDSRLVEPGDLFVAISGAELDGHGFIEDAVARGCAAVLVEKGRGKRDLPSTAIIEVDDSRTALSALAARFYGHPAEKIKMIGVTGTNGKTTTSYLLEAILKEAGHRPGVIGTVNYRYTKTDGRIRRFPAPLTTPDPLILQRLIREMVDGGATHIIMEVSSHALAQKRLAGVFFDVAIFTNLSRDHLDYHGDMASYFASKKQLFTEHLKPDGQAVIVIGHPEKWTDDWGEMLARELSDRKQDLPMPGPKVKTCGLQAQNDIHPDKFSFDVNGIKAELITDRSTIPVFSPLVGDFNLKNILAAATAALALNVDDGTLGKALSRTADIPGRLERVTLENACFTGPAVFVDYAHTPDALENVLTTLRKIAPRRLICVFGCGGDRDSGKRPLMGEVAGQLADIVLVTSDNPRSEDPLKILADIEKGLKKTSARPRRADDLFHKKKTRGYSLIASRRAAIKTALINSRPDDVILISGKGHENYQLQTRDNKIFFDDRLEALKNLNIINSPKPYWNLAKIMLATGGNLTYSEPAEAESHLYGVSTDSRTIRPGDIFVALTGPNFDGLKFASQAVKKGAVAILADRLPVADNTTDRHNLGIPIILVNDPLKALGDMAAYRGRILKNLLKIAITGSSGKTTVKEMTAAIFSRKLKTLKTEGNFNNLIGLPLTLLRANETHEIAVLEMGMNQPGEIARLTEIANPDISCIVNIQEAHLAGLGDLKGVARAKGELFAATKPGALLAINLDDPRVRILAKACGHEKITFGATPAGRRHKPFIRATHIKSLGEAGMAFTLHIGRTKNRIRIKGLGRHNVGNGLAAAAMAWGAGLSLDEISRGLAEFSPIDQRARIETLSFGLKVFNDSYNANPSSMLTALKTLHEIKGEQKVIAVLGDMLELGDKSEECHREVGESVAGLGYDFLATVGEYGLQTVQAARKAGLQTEQAKYFSSKQELTAWLYFLLGTGKLNKGDWLLLKGSRGMRLETILDNMQKEQT